MGQSTIKILKQMIKNEGVKSLYRSFPITFVSEFRSPRGGIAGKPRSTSLSRNK